MTHSPIPKNRKVNEILMGTNLTVNQQPILVSQSVSPSIRQSVSQSVGQSIKYMICYLYVLLRDFIHRIFCSIPLFYEISLAFKKFCNQCYSVERT